MQFEPDVFISYAHLDDESAREGRRWVSNFHRALEIRVGQLLGKKPHIFRDPKLQGNDDFSDRLLNLLRSTGVLVPVLTPRYINSEWTRRELTEFCRAASETGGVEIGDKARVFKVIKTPVPQEKHPPELQRFLGYELFRFDPQTGRPREFEDPEEAYWTKLDDVAYDLKQLLEILEGQEDEENTKDIRTVYLAETTVDLKDEQEAIKRDLQQHGYRVLPSRPLPLVANELEAFIREQLQECHLAVHLIGEPYSLIPEGGRDSLLEIQDRIAAEWAATSQRPRLVWIPPGLRVNDERQAAFIADLRADPRVQRGADLLEGSLEDLKTLIHTRLNPPEQSKPDQSATVVQDVRQIYLLYDRQDQATIVPYGDYVFTQGFEVIHPVFEGDEAEIRALHEENLRICDAVLIHYGAGNELWFQRKLRELDRSRAYGRTRPFRAVGVSIAPPITPHKAAFKTYKATVISQREGFAPGPIKDFLTAVRCE